MQQQPQDELWHLLCRREMLKRSGFNLAAIALGTLLGRGGARAAPEGGGVTPPSILGPRRPHLAPRAKRVIYLHMIGAPSQLDLFDPKPELIKRDGEPCPAELLKGRRFAFIGGDGL